MIYLLRHGEIEGAGEKRYIGQADVALSETGLCQAKWWRQELSGIKFERVFCSDLGRTRETARIVSGFKPDNICIVPALREICLGEWEGRLMADIRMNSPELWYRRGENQAKFRPPGGESFSDLYYRVVPAFEKIASEAAGDILITAHAGVNRMILCHILDMKIADLFRLAQDYGAMNIIDLGKDRRQVVAFNIRPDCSPRGLPQGDFT
jgi:alpha-ribazole phosphatase